MNSAALTVVTAGNWADQAYRPADHVAFLFAESGPAFALDMAGDVFALDGGAAAIIQRLAAGDEAVADGHGKFLKELVTANLLVTAAGPGASPAPSIASGLLARLATLFLRHRRAIRFALLLARVGIKRDGWATTFLLWRRHLGEAQSRIDADAIDRLVAKAAAADLSGADCKERALCAWALARQAGLPASITIGVALHPLAGHSWCKTGERILGDTPSRIARYVPALTYA